MIAEEAENIRRNVKKILRILKIETETDVAIMEFLVHIDSIAQVIQTEAERKKAL